MNRKTLVIVGVAALVAVLALAGASAAWLTSQVSISNGMTPAAVEIEVQTSDSGQEDALQNGQEIQKTITVNNLKTAKSGRPGTYAYIRVAIVPVWRNAQDKSGTGLPVEDIINEIGGDDWTFIPGEKEDDTQNGYFYYYYVKPVSPGGSTEPLNITYQLPEDHAGKELEIAVFASAVQAIGDAKEVWGQAANVLEPYTGYINETPAPQNSEADQTGE